MNGSLCTDCAPGGEAKVEAFHGALVMCRLHHLGRSWPPGILQLTVSGCLICLLPEWRGGVRTGRPSGIPGTANGGPRSNTDYSPTGRPVGIEVFAGDASDSDASSFNTAVTRVRDGLGTEEIIVSATTE